MNKKCPFEFTEKRDGIKYYRCSSVNVGQSKLSCGDFKICGVYIKQVKINKLNILKRLTK